MDLAGLSGRLKALDKESEGHAPAQVDSADARAALEALEGIAEGDEMVTRRKEALAAVETEAARKLEAKGDPQAIGHGLRRLGEAVFSEHELPTEASGHFAGALQRFDEALAELKGQARELLERELGLRAMPDQTGRPIAPDRHNVVDTESGDDPAKDNTVLRQEARGWLLRDEVLARADVVRYASSIGRAPSLPDLEDVQRERLDEGMVGRKK